MRKHVILCSMLCLLTIPMSFLTPLGMGIGPAPLYLMIIWHYHQPWYNDPENSSLLIFPWVRLHTVGNYFKMAYILSKYPEIRVTFTFSGSLISQVLDYLNGSQDYRQALSWKIARNAKLSLEEKVSMLEIPGGFFDINWARVVNVVPRYSSLRGRAQQAFSRCKALPEAEVKPCIASSFSDQDLVDLAMLFNLFWIDPEVLKENYPKLYELRMRAAREPDITFSREVLAEVLRAHMDIMKKTIQIYRRLASKGQIELVPVPYSHPLAPILTDLGYAEDLELHVEKGLNLLKDVFNYSPIGVWPAEQAVNQRVIEIFAEKGVLWTVTDERVLFKSVRGISRDGIYGAWYIPLESGERLYVFFRDSELSDLIGFQYSSWNPERAAQDLVDRIVRTGIEGESRVVVIALDGENPWEHYEEFGDRFLNALYSSLTERQRKGIIVTITPREYLRLIERGEARAKELPEGTFAYLDLAGRDLSDTPMSYFEDGYEELPRRLVRARIAEGSWSDGELATWVGQREENAGWVMLAKAREDVLRANNAKSLEDLEELNPEALENLLRAEASDWWFWWGGEWGLGLQPNRLFKGFLSNAYKASGIDPPLYLRVDIGPLALPILALNTESPRPPERTMVIDGTLSGDEWKEALNVSMSGADVLITLTSDTLFAAIVPKGLSFKDRGLEIALYTTTPRRSVSPYRPGYNVYPRYENRTLGMGLFYEVLVSLPEGLMRISEADGRGGWTELLRIQTPTIRIREVAELAVPLHMIALQPADVAYLTVVIYVNGSIAETASKLGGAYRVVVPRPPEEMAGAKVVFRQVDPLGDDRGPGTYAYPKADVFRPGVFDLARFEVYLADDKVVFKVYVKDLGGNPWNGPNGFSMQYTHIYVRTRLEAPGRTDTLGLNVEISEDSAWHIALLLAPGWGSDPVPKGERAALYYYNGTVLVQDREFTVYADPAGNAIVAKIGIDLLPDLEHIEEWKYVVALASYDGYGPMRVRPVGVEAQEWVVGGGRELAKAILAGVEPRVIDLLAPTAEEQYEMLGSFSVEYKKVATVRALSPQRS